MPSLNAAELRTTSSLERYLIIFRTGQVSKTCMHSLFYFNVSSNLTAFVFLDFLKKLSMVTLLLTE